MGEVPLYMEDLEVGSCRIFEGKTRVSVILATVGTYGYRGTSLIKKMPLPRTLP
jgi:hypothetical protein